MKSPNPTKTIEELLGKSSSESSSSDHSVKSKSLVKICGMMHPEDVSEALSCGANLIGIIFAPSKYSLIIFTYKKVKFNIEKKKTIMFYFKSLLG
jgi:hypothetical protein